MKKLSRFRKILIFSGGAVLLVLICLLLSPGPDPYVNVSNDQWVQMCREAYDSLYQKEHLHFTQHTADMTSSGSTTTSAEIWYSGDNFFQRETRENGDLRAFLMKDGTYYRNRQKELAPAEWKTSSEDPVFVRSSGAWSEVDYTLDHFDLNGKQAEVVFSRDGSLPKKDRLRMHYLTFRFDRDLKLTAIVYAYIAYGGDKVDPNDIFLSQTDEYIFHDTPKSEIESVIDAPLQIMEAHRADAEKWTPIAAAAYEDLCAKALLHYTYDTVQSEYESQNGYTGTEEGWYSGTDSLTVTERSRNITTTYIRLKKGTTSYNQTIRDGEKSDWNINEREPTMHGRYQYKWPEDTYIFYSAETTKAGTDLTFWRVTSPRDHDYIIPGITVVTFHLDKENRLQGITYRQIRESAGGSLLDGEPHILTEYKFHDTTEAQAQKEIDKYYQMAVSGS